MYKSGLFLLACGKSRKTCFFIHRQSNRHFHRKIGMFPHIKGKFSHFRTLTIYTQKRTFSFLLFLFVFLIYYAIQNHHIKIEYLTKMLFLSISQKRGPDYPFSPSCKLYTKHIFGNMLKPLIFSYFSPKLYTPVDNFLCISFFLVHKVSIPLIKVIHMSTMFSTGWQSSSPKFTPNML